MNDYLFVIYRSGRLHIKFIDYDVIDIPNMIIESNDNYYIDLFLNKIPFNILHINISDMYNKSTFNFYKNSKLLFDEDSSIIRYAVVSPLTQLGPYAILGDRLNSCGMVGAREISELVANIINNDLSDNSLKNNNLW